MYPTQMYTGETLSVYGSNSHEIMRNKRGIIFNMARIVTLKEILLLTVSLSFYLNVIVTIII